jgi:hypothetical protein
MFKISQRKHNNLDCHLFFGIFSIIVNFICSKLDTNRLCFFMFKTLKPREWIIFVFFQMSFFSTKCTLFLLKIEKDFNVDD